MFVFARIGRPVILLSVNKFARALTKWTKACDKLLTRLISYIHHTSECRQYCYVETQHNSAGLDCFKTLIFAGDLEDSKSTSGGVLCIFGSHTFAPISWMCKKQTSVSHISTESEIMSLDAGLRMDGVLALDLWDLVIEELGTTHKLPKPTQACMRETDAKIKSTPKNRNVDLSNVDQVPSNAHLSQLFVFSTLPRPMLWHMLPARC